jgi:hypothetical protein
VKEAWDAVRILRVGDERVRDASAQQLRRDFGNLSFKEGETVNDFGVRITTLATNLRTLGDNISEPEVVKKMLHVVPEKLSQAAVSIEMFCDLNAISNRGCDRATPGVRGARQAKSSHGRHGASSSHRGGLGGASESPT